MSQRTRSVPIDHLRVGVGCDHPIKDDRGNSLLDANSEVTAEFINELRDLGIQKVEIASEDFAALADVSKTAATRWVRNEHDAWAKAEPMKDLLMDRHGDGLCEKRTAELYDRMDAAKERFQGFRAQVAARDVKSLEDFYVIADGYARSLIEDHDHTVATFGTLGKTFDSDERSVRMSVLGMAIAIDMGFDGPQTLEVGMTAMLHDIGLYEMDSCYHKPVESMNESEQWEHRKHPLVSVNCISDVMELSESVQLAIQQVHEQFDGSGYPHGSKGHRIHCYARILNVVDSYLQLIGPTSDRRAIVPHDAMGLLLHHAGRGIFDPKVMKAFLNITTMYPLGSLVELNSGELARVIRRPRIGFAQPVLQGLEGERIDLHLSKLKVVRPVCDPEIEQMRLPRDEMQESDWHPSGHHVLVV